MEQWMAWHWEEISITVTIFTGAILSPFLLVNRFPANRFLGQFILCLLMLLSTRLIIVSPVFSTWLAECSLLLSALTFTWYSKAFFTQNSRFNFRHIWLIIGVMGIALYCNFYSLNVLATTITVGAIIGLLINAIRTIKNESGSRGVSWFQNPGSRLIWFRNYFMVTCTQLGVLMYLVHQSGTLFVALIIFSNLLFILYQILSESAFFSPIPVANKYKKSTLSAAQKAGIVEKLDHLILASKFYIKDDASLSKMAEELHTSTHHLSQVLNETKGISFQELISQNRIREARQLLKDPSLAQTKVESIAAMVGYNSKSAFNTAFKRHTGMTPSEYREKKEVLPYREAPLPDKKKPLTMAASFSLSNQFFKKFKRIMVSNFFKTFIRALNRNRVFTYINLIGLVIGFSSSLLIYLYIQDELSYDQSLPASDQIFRISWHNEEPQTRTPHPMAQAMAADWPEVEAAVSISPWYGSGLSKQKIKVKNEKKNILFEEPDFYFADSTFFDVFDLEILEGDERALYRTNLLVISKSMSDKYFGDENPIGQLLMISDMPMEVATVVADMPKNSHFHFNALISYPTIKSFNPDNPWYTWEDFGHFNYIKIKPSADHKNLEANISEWVLGYLDFSEDNEEAIRSGQYRFDLMPIADIHLHSHLRWELENNGNAQYVYILTGTLVFLLLIAIINYINLTTAKSVDRAKEIGIRKTLGAVSGNLTFQFYLESILFSVIAVLISIGVAILCLRGFNQLSDKIFEPIDLLDNNILGPAILMGIMVGLFSGFYPAMNMASYKPSEVLKGKFSHTRQGNYLRGSLVVVQFSVSAILIASSLIILGQIKYMQTKDLGLDKEAVITLSIPKSVKYGGIHLPTVRTVQNEIKSLAGVKNVSAVSNLPGGQFNQNSIYAALDPSTTIGASELQVDFGAIEALGLHINAGRSFDQSYASDSAGVSFVLNEAARSALALSNPIGEKIVWLDDEMTREGKIIGVVKDFHYKSLHEEIQPLIMQILPADFNHMVVKVEHQNFENILSKIETIYQKFDIELPFEYHFLDQQLAGLYEKDQRTLDIFSIFGMIALFLACLGLLGIALAMMSQKVKEVGMRKILGASAFQIVQMIFLKFSKLIAISLIIGLSLAHLIMREWLNEFPYQVPFDLVPFLVSSILLLFVAMLSVGFVVIKIAATNPSSVLKYE